MTVPDFIDLMLFHRRLRSLVAVELKIGEFQPAITSFDVGSQARSVRLKRIETLDQLQAMNGGRAVGRECCGS